MRVGVDQLLAATGSDILPRKAKRETRTFVWISRLLHLEGESWKESTAPRGVREKRAEQQRGSGVWLALPAGCLRLALADPGGCVSNILTRAP